MSFDMNALMKQAQEMQAQMQELQDEAAKETAEADELGLHVPLELVELGNASRFDELAQARRDPGTDPSQLLDAAVRDEVGNRRLRLADRLRSAAVRARRIEAAARKVEQHGECFESLRDRGVVEGCRHGVVSLAAWSRMSFRTVWSARRAWATAVLQRR